MSADRVRATILLGSAASGLLLGLFVGLGVLALLALASTTVPGAARLATRARTAALVVTLLVLPLAGALLGWLEGRAKLR